METIFRSALEFLKVFLACAAVSTLVIIVAFIQIAREVEKETDSE